MANGGPMRGNEPSWNDATARDACGVDARQCASMRVATPFRQFAMNRAGRRALLTNADGRGRF
jgi:hypothetical protein